MLHTIISFEQPDLLWHASLILVRITALLLSAPVFNSKQFPLFVNAALALSLTAACTASAHTYIPMPADIWTIGGTLLMEVVIGISIGTLSTILISSMQSAGTIIGMSMGVWIQSLFDPDTNMKVSPTGRIMQFIGLALFLAADWHLLIVNAALTDFSYLPAGDVFSSLASPDLWIPITASHLKLSFAIAFPVLAVTSLTNLAMALAARLVPQINIFAVGLIVIMGIGLLAWSYSAYSWPAKLDVAWQDFWFLMAGSWGG